MRCMGLRRWAASRSCLSKVSVATVLALVIMCAALSAQAKPKNDEVKKPVSFKTLAFDNARFFAAPSKGGKESGLEGWAKITAKGKREFLSAIDPKRCALIAVDFQSAYDPDRHENARRLLKFCHEKDILIVFLALSHPGLIPDLSPLPERLKSKREVLLVKYTSGALFSCGMEEVLRENGIATLFFIGMDTAGCVYATMSGSFDRGYQTIMIDDACQSFAPGCHDAAVKLWRYKGFVRTTDQVVNDYPWKKWVDPSVTRN